MAADLALGDRMGLVLYAGRLDPHVIIFLFSGDIALHLFRRLVWVLCRRKFTGQALDRLDKL